jgi:hypothetical protein
MQQKRSLEESNNQEEQFNKSMKTENLKNSRKNIREITNISAC